MPPQAPRCRVCGTEVERAQALACVGCRSPHHRDCWLYQGGCAIYGCGSDRAVPAEALPVIGTLEITDEAPAPWGPRLQEALQRRLLWRARDLPFTVREGLFGATLTALAYLAVEGITGPLAAPLRGFFTLGMLHGLLAPWLAPWIHRHPGLLSLCGALLFVGTFPSRLISFPLLRTTLQVLVVSVSAAGTAEFLLSDRSPSGERLGALALPLRYGFTFLVATSLWLAVFWARNPEWVLAWRELRFFAFLGLLSTTVAAPTLERGQREFRRKLRGDMVES